MVNYFIIFILSVITVIIIRILKKSFTSKYFSLNQIIIANEEPFNIVGFIIIMMPLFIGSILASAILGKDQLDFILLYGFSTAFLIIWPILLYPMELLPTEAYVKKKSVYFVYFLFIMTYVVLSYGGYSFFYSFIKSSSDRKTVLSYIFDLYEVTPPMIQGLLDNIVWVLLFSLISFIKKKLKIKEVN